jgi:hypothetical protein
MGEDETGGPIEMKYRATLTDNDASRERSLTIHGNSMPEIERWAATVLETAIEGAAVNVFALEERHVKMIPKKAKA